VATYCPSSREKRAAALFALSDLRAECKCVCLCLVAMVGKSGVQVCLYVFGGGGWCWREIKK
jgi:hypothetical protein